MGAGKLPDFEDLSERDLPTYEELKDLEDDRPIYTETIDLGHLSSSDTGALGDFGYGGGIPEQLQKLLHALPVPSVLVGQSFSLIFLNESCAKITPHYRKIERTSFLSLFPRQDDVQTAREAIERVFTYRTPQSIEGILAIGRTRIWSRINMRSLRFGQERAILALIEDLTLVKRQLIVDRKRKIELRKARDQLEKRVEERTLELQTTNAHLEREVSDRKRAEQDLRRAHGELELRVQERTAELSRMNEQLRLEITERKRAEEKLLLDAKIIESSNEAIVITDSKAKIVDVNKSFSSVTGYKREEIIGKDPLCISSEREEAKVLWEIRKTVRKTGHWQGEIWNRRKDGEIYPVLLSISSVTDDDGLVTHYVGIFSDITKMKQTEERLQQLAHNDPLTGLPNRVLFRDRMEQAILQAERNERMAVLMLLDLDRFKNINDTFGHKVGDELLVAVGERLRTCVRKSDTVARFGGDEFTIVLSGVTETRAAAEVSKKIIETLAQPFELDGRQLFITASIGIAVYPEDSFEPDRLLQNADTALYHAKQQGRDNFEFFSQELNVKVLKRLELELDLRGALERKEFTLYYQPIVDIETGRISCAEALLRWIHPRRGLLHPESFIPVAEETGLIVPLGEWVLENACAQGKAWQEIGLPPLPVAVNISGRQFGETDLVPSILKILERTELDPLHLELELTETVSGGNAEETVVRFNELREHGIRISIDDFGTGYSSLSYLKRFPIEKLKIDRSFVRDIASDPDDAAIVQAIVGVAHGLNLKVVAEGVETEEQLEHLGRYGCDEWQGYFFCEPLPAIEFTQMMLKNRSRMGMIPTDMDLAKPSQFEVLFKDWMLPATNLNGRVDSIAGTPLTLIGNRRRVPF
jgi:diguanylate cyclase (GGDEF)-like protein/PAS domain S-box-containing protein